MLSDPGLHGLVAGAFAVTCVHKNSLFCSTSDAVVGVGGCCA
jgi:hypothetical protein